MRERPLALLGYGIAGALVLFAVSLLVLLLVPGAVGAEGSYVVRSGSMSPAIDAGDLIVLRAVDPDSITAGDVITFDAEAGAETTRVTHRVVAVERTSEGLRYRTEGDANEEPDPSPVAPDAVIGAVWFTIPLVGWLVAFAGSDLGLLVLVVLPALALAALELRALYHDATADREPSEVDRS